MSASFRNRTHQCFVSYSHEDADFVNPLVSWLNAAGIPIWQDDTSLAVGEMVARASTILPVITAAAYSTLNSVRQAENH